MQATQREAAHARAMVYHALAEALAQPIPGIEELLLEAATTGARVLDSAACQRAALALAELSMPDIEALRKSYHRLLTDPGQRPVALYESLYRYGRLAGPVTWEVATRYQTLGLAPIDGELPDHASVELAFLGHLAAAEAEARANGDGQLVARLRKEQRSFLQSHAATWLPDVGAALATCEEPFYAIVGRLLGEFLAEELAGRKQATPSGARIPMLSDVEACTLCGLCVGSCPLGALQVRESATQTTLTLNPAQCVGCDRCTRICPEHVLFLADRTKTPDEVGSANGAGHWVLRQSQRATCPNCGQPTVSQAELDAVFARLQPDPATRWRMSLCVECKSWGM